MIKCFISLFNIFKRNNDAQRYIFLKSPPLQAGPKYKQIQKE